MLTSFWNWFAIIVTIAMILACWWLLHWTKGISDREEGKPAETGHVWDHDIRELNNPLPRWWLNLFNITIIFALIYLVLYPGLGNLAGVLGWTQLGQYQDEMQQAEAAQAEVFARFKGMSLEDLAHDTEAMGIGRRLFGNNCAMCHGSDGRGAPGFPNLTDDEWQWGGSDDDILNTIQNGRQAAMPAWAPALGEDGTRQVAEYVMQISGHEADPELAAAGQEKFATFCVACHGPEGKGNPLMGAPDLTNSAWLYGGDRATVMEGLHTGRNGKMPEFGDKLSDERRRILAAYVKSLGGAAAQP